MNAFSAVHVIQAGTISNLTRLGDGSHKCGRFAGWITVRNTGDAFEVMWTTGRDTHQPLDGPAVFATFSDAGATHVCRSALSMWPERDTARAARFVVALEKKIQKAVSRKPPNT